MQVSVDMPRITSDQFIHLAGVALHADPAGALVHEGERALLVADLHLEKGSAYARRGQFLPPFDTAATLARLAALIMRHRPRVVIALGDSFHDRFGWSRMSHADRDALTALQAGRDWVWIFGNHDPVFPEAIGGEKHAHWSLGPLTLRHEPAAVPASLAEENRGTQAGEQRLAHLPSREVARAKRAQAGGVCPNNSVGRPRPAPSARPSTDGRVMLERDAAPLTGEIAGHFHPVALVAGKRRRCFVTDGRRLVMPAFGAYAGGLNLHDRAIASLFAGRRFAHVLGRDRVYALCVSKCLPD